MSQIFAGSFTIAGDALYLPMMAHTKRYSILQTFGGLTRALVVLALIVYGAYVIGRSVFANYTINQQIASLRGQIHQIEVDIAELKNLIVYYESDSFKEIEARRRLGMRAPGEQVVILPKPEDRKLPDGTPETVIEAQKEKDAIPNPQKWISYILGV